MKQDIRVSITTSYWTAPYPTCCEEERQRLGEINNEIKKYRGKIF